MCGGCCLCVSQEEASDWTGADKGGREGALLPQRLRCTVGDVAANGDGGGSCLVPLLCLVGVIGGDALGS